MTDTERLALADNDRLALMTDLRAEIKAAKDMITCLERQSDDYRARQRVTYYRGMADAFERVLSRVVLVNREGVEK